MILHKDQTRAREKVPRHDYKGVDFTDMSHVLNGWLNSSYDATPCEMWSVEELQELQASAGSIPTLKKRESIDFFGQGIMK